MKRKQYNKQVKNKTGIVSFIILSLYLRGIELFIIVVDWSIEARVRGLTCFLLFIYLF